MSKHFFNTERYCADNTFIPVFESFISLSINHEYQIIAYYTKTNLCDRL